MKRSKATGAEEEGPPPSGLFRVVGVCAAIALLVTIGYGASAWEMVVYRLLTDGVIALLWLGAGIGLGGVVLRRFVSCNSNAFFVATAGALGLGLMSLGVLGLGLLGWLNVWSTWGMVLVGLGMGVLWVFRRTWSAELTTPVGWERWLWVLAMPALGIALVSALVPAGVLWGDEPHGYDVTAYHFQIPREWVEAGRIVPLEHNVFSYFPFNVEMHFLLAMHLRGGPWAGMFLAQLMHVGFFVVLVVGVYGGVRELLWEEGPPRGGGLLGGTVGGVLVGVVPWAALLAPVGYNEGGMVLFGGMALVWALLALQRGGMREFALAGVMAGLACGSKYTAVPMVLVAVPLAVVVGALWAAKAQAGWGRLLAGVALFGVMGVVMFAPWMVRNCAWVGNPVFPQGMGLLGKGHFSEVQVERWERAHAAREDQPVWRRGADLVRELVRHPGYGHLLLPLGIAAGVVWSRRRIEARVLLVLALIWIGFWLFFTHLQSRFLVLLIPAAGVMVGLSVGGMNARAAAVSRRERGEKLWPGIAAGAAAVMAVLGWAHLHERLMGLDERFRAASRGEVGLFDWLGFEQFDRVLQHGLDEYPPDTVWVLVGDAEAFQYHIPMERLRYRSVFDVDTSGDRGVIEAWTEGVEVDERTRLLVNPLELDRFHRTYYGIPRLGDEVAGPRDRPFVIGAAEAAGER